MAMKTNERAGTRAVLRSCRMSSYKAREVLDLVRGQDLQRALELLDHIERAAAPVIAKLVRSAAANAEHNDGLDPEELYVAACFADEGETLKRWRPRARGRATRIRKRSCHITVILARMSDEQLARKRAHAAAEMADRRARRVAGARRRQAKPGEASTSSEVAKEALAGDEVPEIVSTPQAHELNELGAPEVTPVIEETDGADDAPVAGAQDLEHNPEAEGPGEEL